jgi:hypothetical protein
MCSNYDMFQVTPASLPGLDGPALAGGGRCQRAGPASAARCRVTWHDPVHGRLTAAPARRMPSHRRVPPPQSASSYL